MAMPVPLFAPLFCTKSGGTITTAYIRRDMTHLGRKAPIAKRVHAHGLWHTHAAQLRSEGIDVGITPEKDYPDGPLAGVAFQRKWESAAFVAGGRTYAAPAQRVGDFIARRPSTSLGSVVPSYTPGVLPTDLTPCLPASLPMPSPPFAKRSRRSAAGYAGGILSAGVDGIKVAEAVAQSMLAG